MANLAYVERKKMVLEKLLQIEKALNDVWESLTPNVKSNYYYFEKFVEVQKRLRKLNFKTEVELKHEKIN